MFFIGVFGINRAQKPIGSCGNVVCPVCGAFSRLEISRAYTYFHVFFIPTFRWNTRYYAKSSCCGAVFELDPGIGRQYEAGMNPDIRNEHLHLLSRHSPFATCSGCGADVESGFSFCPYCGKRLA